jgi:hypothetical protein
LTIIRKYGIKIKGGCKMNKLLLGILFVFLSNLLTAAELTEEQLWAIALTGIMTERNKSNYHTLNSSEMNERNKNMWLEVLKRDWGINNRDELLQTLDKMEHDGHANDLKYIQRIITEIVEEKESFYIIAVYNKYQLNSKQYNYLKFTVINWNVFNERSILAWDLGRNIALCRWGYDVGFLTEEEAWEKIMYYAKLIQPLYNSWEEYGYDYYMGRVFWASGFGEDMAYLLETYQLYQKLMGESGYWHNLEWNIDLN